MDPVAEALRQVVEGADFTPPEELLRTVKPAQAVAMVPGSPYSIATNVAHADIWNRLWLARLRGEKKFNPFPDFPSISEADWPSVRDRFVENLVAAQGVAEAKSKHAMKSDEAAAKVLLQIAVHTAYHLGQVRLLKRLLRGKSKLESQA